MKFLDSKTIDEINIGDSVSLVQTLTNQDISLFALASGDVNPLYVDTEYAQSTPGRKINGHSVWIGALISSLLGTRLPGAGTVYRRQALNFIHPVLLGDKLTVTITVIEKNTAQGWVTFHCQVTNQHHELVTEGQAEVIPPAQKVQRLRIKLPCIYLENPGTQLQRLVAMTEQYDPVRMAVVHPVDGNSLAGAMDAAKANLIVPVLVGPIRRICAVAEQEGIDLSDCELVDTEHSHDAAIEAVAMARAGRVNAIMKGSLHTDELMHAAVQRSTGISTARRMSHVFLMDVPTYPKPLMVTDAVVTIDPTLEEKRDIVQNAIELAHALGIEEPKVALLSAVETVNPKMRSTLEAAAICKMAHRKQITGGLVDGPLAYDNAISEEAARIKGIESTVAGRADILVAPDLEAGNMVVKQLEYMANAQSSGIVLGARVPVALTSRADPPLNRMASCALALLLAQNKSTIP